MASDPVVALTYPGLVLGGDPGAQRNRDQVVKLVEAVDFNLGGLDPYQVPNVTNGDGPAVFPALAELPLRDPALGEGEGQWFISGQELLIQVDCKIEATPLAGPALLYVGIYYDPAIGQTTLSQGILQSGAAAMQSNAQVPVGGQLAQIKHFFTVSAMGPQEQWHERQVRYWGSGGGSNPSAAIFNTSSQRSEDFTGTEQRRIGVFCNVLCTQASDVSEVVVRLKRVRAYLTGVPGKNE